jgi:hypothetical protein
MEFLLILGLQVEAYLIFSSQSAKPPSMTINLTIQEHIGQIALSRDISRSEARRILIERIDLAKRQKLEKSSQPTQPAGYRDAADRRQVQTHNPHRRLVGTEIKKPTPILSEKQKIALSQQNTKRQQARLERFQVPVPDLWEPDFSIFAPPAPGTTSSTILGVIRDTSDLTEAFRNLRQAVNLQHLTDHGLRQQISRVAKRYGLC